MTYNEWRDELKSNLLSVSESERRRVLDYYAEAYADRRDAGYTEREIIEDFGAPYDAAQRILSDGDSNYYEPSPSRSDRRQEERERREQRAREERERREERAREERERREERAREERTRREERAREERERREDNRQNQQYGNNSLYGNYCGPNPTAPAQTRGDYTWVFVLLCIVFSIPIFIVVMGMVGITVGVCVAPLALMISGVASIGAGVGSLFADVASGTIAIGTGLVVFGLSLIATPLCFQLVKWMWKLFGMFFAWLRRLFSGKKCA